MIAACGGAAALPVAPPTKPVATVPSSSPSSAEAASPAEEAPLVAPLAAPPVSSSPPPPPSIPLARLPVPTFKSYAEALAAGRRAAVAKHFDVAVAAFTSALQIKKDDPVALGERAFAFVLAGDTDDALGDLDDALQSTDDSKANLFAQLQFTLGLTRRKRGELVPALEAFAASNHAHGTDAAAKACGELACDAARTGAPVTARVVPSWSEVYSLAQSTPPGQTPPKATDDGDARRRLCGADRCNGKAPWIVHDDGDWHGSLVLPVKGGFFVLPLVVEKPNGGFKCPMEFPTVTAERNGSVVHVAYDLSLCHTEQQGPDPVNASPVDDGTRHVEGWWAIRVGGLALMVDDTPRDPCAVVRASATDDAIQIDGDGCSVSVPLPRP
jgi:hypothetical protein